MGLSQELPGNSDNSLRTVLLGEDYRPILLSQIAGRLLFFTATMFLKFLVFKVTAVLGRGKWEQGKFKCHKSHCSSREFSIFLMILWLISGVLTMLILTIFASALVAFMACHSGSVSSPWVNLVSGLLLTHTFQSTELSGEYRIRKMEMGVLKGCSWMVMSGACFHLGEVDIYVSRGMLYLIFLCTRATMMRYFP